ncbi:MAG: hypothetical protein Q9209_004259 [Squamulea sp. 1 TL-2023]
MLQEALVSPTAKLDISRLLKSSASPSPPPSSTASIPSFSRSFSGPSIEAGPRAVNSPTISPTSYFPSSTFGASSPNARRPIVTGPPTSLSIPAASIKRTASTSPQESRHTSKKPTRQWSEADNEKLLRLRGANMKWDDVARHFEGRTNTACRLRYQNYLEKKHDWTDEKKKSLAVQYERRKQEMWEPIARELMVPWRAVEDMHWALGQVDMANLAGGRLLHPDRSGGEQSPTGNRMPAALPPPAGPPSIQARFMSTPTSTFPRHPSHPEAMAQPLSLATTAAVSQPRFVPGIEDTGVGFHHTQRRQSRTGGQLPSLAELDRSITAYAAHGHGRYRDEIEEDVEKREEMEEEGGGEQR